VCRDGTRRPWTHRPDRRHDDVGGGHDIGNRPHARIPIWDKFVYLAPFAGFTGASRLAIGHIWKFPHVQEMFYAASREIAAIAKAEGVEISANRFDTLREYMQNLPASTRSSLLIDLEQGKRIEVEALQGAAVRRAARHGIAVPIMSTLYALLKPMEKGPVK
ncbi:MAG: ketopantoate reductase family protein, partial [Acidimicrobiia bacterium]